MAQSESAFQDKVVKLAAVCGWMLQHSRRVQTANGRHMTAIVGQPGYPDLTITHHRWGAWWLELKSSKGLPEPDQVAWLRTLPPGRSFVLRPESFDEFVAPLLTGGSAAYPHANLWFDGVSFQGPMAKLAGDRWEEHCTAGWSKHTRRNR